MPDNIQFTNPEVAAKYEALTDYDHNVTRQLLYSGPLSKITPAMAAAMVKGKSNLIRERPATKTQAATEMPEAEKAMPLGGIKTPKDTKS